MRNPLSLLVLAICIACGPRGGAVPSISVTKFETVTGPPGESGFEGFTLISPELSGGRRIAFQPNPPSGPPLVLGPDGRVTDTLAKVGSGPGEVQWVSRVVRGPGDTVYLVDANRLLVYSPALHFIRSFPIAIHSAWGAVALPSGEVVIATSTSMVPEVVTAWSPDDGLRRWGVTIPRDPAVHIARVRCLAVAPDGTLWTLRAVGQLEFEHFAADGRRLGGIIAAPPWYPPNEKYQMPSRTAPPSPSAAGFWVDTLGRAWVVGSAPDPHWASAPGKDQPGEGGSTFFTPDHPEQVRDGVIDVIDLATGRSVTSARSDTAFGIPIEPWVLQRTRIDADGWQQVDLYRVGAVAVKP